METIKKNSVLLPTAYFGPVEYFYYLLKFNTAIVEQHETWPKQTYRNRAIIATDKGTIPITIPVNKVNGNSTKTSDIVISYAENWHIKHWRAIETAYNNSPYFLYYADEIKALLFSQTTNLISLNMKLTELVCELIGIRTDILLSTTFVKKAGSNVLDLRYKISPKLPPTLSHFPKYTQVFSDKQPFFPNVSIIDLLFCLGPDSKSYLDSL